MAIRLADTARPNNHVDAEHLGTFPVAYAEDVWFEDGTRLSEKTFGGDSIQKEELPLASADELGNIYQYIGETGTYTKGYFYECVSDGKSTPTYSWQEVGSGGEASNQTIKWEEAQRSVKRNYIEIIDKTTKALDDDLIIESHKEGYIDIAYSPTTYRSTFNISYSCYDFDHFFTFNGVSGEYKLITNFVDNNDESNNQIMESYSSMAISNGDDFEVHGQIQKGSLGYTIILYVQNRTTDQHVNISGSVNNIADVTLYPVFLLSSIKNTSWEPATILDNIQLNEKIINTFIGTQAEWDALTTAQKKTYDIVNITDDESSTDGIKEYIKNQNVLSDYENITLPVSSIPYDGLLTVSVSNGGYVSFSINARNFTIGSASGTSDTSEIALKKGDNVGFIAADGTYGIYVRYYKLRDYTGR